MTDYVLTKAQWETFFERLVHPNFNMYGSYDHSTVNVRTLYERSSGHWNGFIRRTGSQSISLKSGYYNYDLGTTNRYGYTFPANTPRYDGLTFTNIPKTLDGSQGDTLGSGTTYQRYINLPYSTTTAAALETRLQNVYNGIQNAYLYAPSSKKKIASRYLYLNDLMQHKEPFGPRSRLK